MDPTRIPERSTEVVQLVESVERLADADQHRILKIVTLLTRVPPSVQQTTQRMLRGLLETDPDSLVDCVASVDEVIEYLENEVIVHNGATALFDRFEPVAAPSWSLN